jgi:Fur family ferric uptake transcriptional regulator
MADKSLESALATLREAGFRITPQRRAVVKEVMAQEGHISPADLAERVTRKLPGVNAATVYRTLWLLDELKILTHAHLEEGVTYHHLHASPHVHLTCSSCGTSEALAETDLRSLARLMQESHGFSPDFTHFAISGLCRRCQTATHIEHG